jgi:hypothetical protein
MKKSLVLFALISLCSMSISAQVYRVGVAGVGAGGGKNSGRIALHIVEASYAPNPNMDFGAYLGTAIGSKGTTGSIGTRYGVQSKYYFLTEKFKPFVGVQLGFNSRVKVEGAAAENLSAGTKLQFVPQAGFRYGPLNVWASYQNSGLMINGGLVFGFGNFDN